VVDVGDAVRVSCGHAYARVHGTRTKGERGAPTWVDASIGRARSVHLALQSGVGERALESAPSKTEHTRATVASTLDKHHRKPGKLRKYCTPRALRKTLRTNSEATVRHHSRPRGLALFRPNARFERAFCRVNEAINHKMHALRRLVLAIVRRPGQRRGGWARDRPRTHLRRYGCRADL
jgi:hypothetical protein